MKEVKEKSDNEVETPFEKRCCYDCGHMFAQITWWCGSQEAFEYRGTRIPGVRDCPFWKPDWSMIPRKFKTSENGYKSLWQRIKELFSTREKTN